jgi:hypothetical protein
MIIVWDAYPDNGAIGYGLGTVLNWTSSIPPSGWTTPTSVHSKCGETSPYVATRAIDGDTSAFSYWWHQSLCYHWIKFDFGATYNITKIRLYQSTTISNAWGTYTGLEVYVSDDPGNWGSAVWTGALDDPGWQESGAFDKDGRYVKLVSKTSAQSQRLYEFEGYCGEPGVGANIIPVFMKDYRTWREA